MSSDHPWRITIRNLEIKMRIGLHPHEKEPQRVIINVDVEVLCPLHPESIDECFNYDALYHLLAVEWPKRPHQMLLETCVADLLSFIFKLDARVNSARVSIAKTDIFADMESVGVEAMWSRADFERLGAEG